MEIFADTSTFNAGVKEKNTKTNKITIVKNQVGIFMGICIDLLKKRKEN
jgi:hypothetical protein